MTPSEQHFYIGGHSTFVNDLDSSRFYGTDIYGQLINPYTTNNTASSSPSSNNINHHHHQYHYSSSHSHQQQHHSQNNNSSSSLSPMRTIYLGNVTSDIQVCDVMDHVKTGQIQSIRALPEKNGLFITFVESNAATQFYYESINNHLTIQGHELKIGWGKPSHLTTSIQTALQNGASRNVYLGSLGDTKENDIRQNLSRFGHIEKIKWIPEKKIAFVHFLCISNAVKCVNTLQTESQWQSKRVNFGKDRCSCGDSSSYGDSGGDGGGRSIQTQLQQQQQQPQKMYILPVATTSAVATGTSTNSHHSDGYHHRFLQHHQPLLISPQAAVAATPLSPPLIQSNTTATYDIHTGLPLLQFHHYTQQQQQQQQQSSSNNSNDHNGNLHHHHHHHPLSGSANRTIYLGNIHPDTTAEDICNVVRGGILSQIRFMPDKHIAFITFVDPMLAETFYNTTECLVIKNRRLKLGWGKPSQLPLTVLQAVQNGASRNVYIGNIDELITPEKLKHDFSEYGEIELVNTLKEKNCAFVNFTSIAGAIRAIEGIRSKEEYKKFRINYGKDRCGNPPKTYHTNGSSNVRSGGIYDAHYRGAATATQQGGGSLLSSGEEEEPATTTASSITTPNNHDSRHIINNKSTAVVVAENDQQANSNNQQITSSPAIVAPIKLY